MKVEDINDNNELIGEHVAMVLMQNCVLVFQELDFDVFNGVRDRISAKSGRIRTKDSDYLFFALLDSIIDNYFVVLEHISHKIETLEDELYENPTPEVARNIQQLKKEVLKIRQWIFPVKELVGRLIDSENPLISKDTKFFLRDALDHSYEINESLQIYREMAMSLMEMYMSNMSNKMNEVMKVLDYVLYFYSIDFYCRYLRNELCTYARTTLEIWLFPHLGHHDCGIYRDGILFQKEKLAITRILSL